MLDIPRIPGFLGYFFFGGGGVRSRVKFWWFNFLEGT